MLSRLYALRLISKNPSFYSAEFYISVYFITCVLISIPIIVYVWNILHTSQGIPTGNDPPIRIYYIENIIKTHNPLIVYSGFPEINSSIGIFYPSLFYDLIAALTVIISGGGTITFYSVLHVVVSFMFIIYIIGIIGYALLIKSIIDKVIDSRTKIEYKKRDSRYRVAYCGLLLLAFGLFIFSTSPMIKNLRDGEYGAFFSNWCLFPFYVYFLFNKRWLISAVMLAAIASTHNLSFIVSIWVTTAFIASVLIGKDFQSLRRLKRPIIIFFILFLPAFILFYYPSIISSLSGQSGGITPGLWSTSSEVQLITPYLYYGGMICSAVVWILDTRRLGWLTAWSLLYLALFTSSFVGAERFGRELCLPFGLIIGVCTTILFYRIIFTKNINHIDVEKGSNSSSNRKTKTKNDLDRKRILCAIFIPIIFLPAAYAYFDPQFKLNSDPHILTDYSTAKDQSNKYFLNIVPSDKNVNNGTLVNGRAIVVFGKNDWLRPMVYGKFVVLNTKAADRRVAASAEYISKLDKHVNDRLRTLLERPNSRDALKTINDYNLDYIYVSDFIPGQWYSLADRSEKPKLQRFQADSHPNYIHLEREFKGKEGELYRIYSIDHRIVNADMARLQ